MLTWEVLGGPQKPSWWPSGPSHLQDPQPSRSPGGRSVDWEHLRPELGGIRLEHRTMKKACLLAEMSPSGFVLSFGFLF